MKRGKGRGGGPLGEISDTAAAFSPSRDTIFVSKGGRVAVFVLSMALSSCVHLVKEFVPPTEEQVGEMESQSLGFVLGTKKFGLNRMCDISPVAGASCSCGH